MRKQPKLQYVVKEDGSGRAKDRQEPRGEDKERAAESREQAFISKARENRCYGKLGQERGELSEVSSVLTIDL